MSTITSAQATKKPYFKPEMEICDLPEMDIVTVSHDFKFTNRGYKQTQFDTFASPWDVD